MENRSKYLKYGLHAVILVGLIWAAVKYVNGAEVWQGLQNFQYRFMTVLLALAVVYLLLKAARFAILIGPFASNLSRLALYKAYISGQAATLLPGGIAARAGLMKQVGIPLAESSLVVAVHSGWDQAIFLVSALVAALWFPTARLPVLSILAVLSVVALLLIVRPTRQWLAGMAERMATRFKYEKQWQQFLEAIPQVFTGQIVLLCLLLTLATLVLYIVILYLTLRGFDLAVTYPTLFVAVILPTMLGRIVPIPGGVGVTEASMVGFLSSLGGLDTNITVGAVAIFRIVTIVIPAVLGALVYFFFWRGEEEVEEQHQPVDSVMEASHASSPDL